MSPRQDERTWQCREGTTYLLDTDWFCRSCGDWFCRFCGRVHGDDVQVCPDVEGPVPVARHSERTELPLSKSGGL